MDKHTKDFKGKMLMIAVVQHSPDNAISIIRDNLMDIPALADMDIDHDNPHHDKKVLDHCFDVFKKVANVTDNNTVRLAALFHDCGKPSTKVVQDGHARFHGHDTVGADIALKTFIDLGIPQKVAEDAALLIKNHMRPLGYINQPFGNKGVRRLINKSQGHNVDIADLMTLNRADIEAHDPKSVAKSLPGHFALLDHISRIRGV